MKGIGQVIFAALFVTLVAMPLLRPSIRSSVEREMATLPSRQTVTAKPVQAKRSPVVVAKEAGDPQAPQTAETQLRARTLGEETTAAATEQQSELNIAIAEIRTHYPQLNPHHPRYDQKLVDEALARTQTYIKTGEEPSTALRFAIVDMERTPSRLTGRLEPSNPAVSPPPAAPALPEGKGGAALVQLAIFPWGEVFVNGKPVGVSPPMSELELRPGRYRIEVRNGEFRPYQEEVALASNETLRIKHKFGQQR